MSIPPLYRGPWPQNVSRLAKYAVRSVDGQWKVTVLYESGVGIRYLAVEGNSDDLVSRINGLKTSLRSQPGGAFYVNEHRHVLVPVAAEDAAGVSSLYYYAGRLEQDFRFEFNGQPLQTRAVDVSGLPLQPGASWIGPRPGIPYVLAAGGADIYYETPALTDEDPPRLMRNSSRREKLSRVLANNAAVARAVRPVAAVRGHQGGRFYVNEHGAMFTPVAAGDGNGLDYKYCGQIDYSAWFPVPPVP